MVIQLTLLIYSILNNSWCIASEFTNILNPIIMVDGNTTEFTDIFNPIISKWYLSEYPTHLYTKSLNNF